MEEPTLWACSPYGKNSSIHTSLLPAVDLFSQVKIQGNISTNLTSSHLNDVVFEIPDAEKILITESPDCISGGAWQDYASSKPVKLSPGDGIKTLYISVKKNNGSIRCVQTKITVDTTAPKLTIDLFMITNVNSSNANSYTLTGTCSENNRPVIIRNYATDLTSTTCTENSWSVNLNLSADYVANTKSWFLNANQTDEAHLEGEYQAWVYRQLSPIVKITASGTAFAAIRADGSVSTWGGSYNGGDSSTVQDQLVGVSQIYSTGRAFVALKKNGTVVAWGASGGDATSVQDQLVDVDKIYSTGGAFAALKSNSTVVVWGDSDSGGDASSVQDQLVDVDKIHSTDRAFAALKSDGTVVAWGDSYFGGYVTSYVQDQLIDVSHIYSTNGAFAALKNGGSVVTWGDSHSGGDASSVEDQLVDVDKIYSTNRAFAALKSDGTVVVWGDLDSGGDASSVQDQLVNIT